MTERELLCKIEGFLCAHEEQGLTREQLAVLLKMAREETASCLEPFPYYPYTPAPEGEKPNPYTIDPVSDYILPSASLPLPPDYPFTTSLGASQ